MSKIGYWFRKLWWLTGFGTRPAEDTVDHLEDYYRNM